MKGKTSRKKTKKNVPIGRVSVKATFNNIIITFADMQGDVIAQSSAGACGFKGAKKSTPYAAQVAAQKAAGIAKEYGFKTGYVFVQGPGAGRESAIRAIHNSEINIASITDVTPVPHNGCRPPKRRRV